MRLAVVVATDFPDLAKKYKVSVVPKVWINDRISIDGAAPESYLLEKMKEAVAPVS